MSWSMRHYLVVATFLVCLDRWTDGAKFMLTVPTKPHYDTQYTATVTGYEIYTRESISLEYRGLKDSSKIINSTVLWFDQDGVQTWTVTFPWDLMESYQETAVTLTLATMWKEEKKTLYFNKDSGYIFIQTDKPLYTPRQTVKFRIIAVDEYQRVAQYPLKVDIRNEKMIVMDRMRYTAEEAFKGQEFELPKETPAGNWTITANYEGLNNVESNAKSVTFEVKEYVLPRFSAKVKVSKDVITQDTNWITITVTAEYVYGHYTLGSVAMQLGIWDPASGVKMVPKIYTSNLTKGEYKTDIRVSALIPRDLIVRASRRLYVAVNVTEEGTGEVDRVIDTSTFIAHPYYDITYTDSKKTFKPGFPYTLHTQVRARSGRPASWLMLFIAAEFRDANGRRIHKQSGYHPMDKDGKNRTDFDTPPNAHTVKFKTVVLDFQAGTNNDAEFMVPKLPSENSQYLHISLVKSVKKYSNGLVKLRYTPPGNDAMEQRITVTVLSKGHTVFSHSTVRTSDGQSLVPLPRNLHTEIAPSMRIVASFYHTSGDKPEFVIDSLNVDTEDVCLEELFLIKPGGSMFSTPVPKKPKDKYNLVIRGGPGMDVGMVAVDEAVFLLNDARSLSRESLFHQLGSHDAGKGCGDGTSIEEVLKNSGLVHLFVDNDEHVAWDGTRGREGRRGQTGHVASKMFGRQDPNSSSDRGFMLHVNTGDRVRGAMTPLGMMDQAPPQTTRQYFPESWLFEEFRLPKSGKMSLNLTLPDSITTWSFQAVGLSATRGVCVSDALQQRVQKMFFVDVRLPYKVTRLEEVKVKVAIYNYRTEPIEITVDVSGSQGLCFSANRVRGTSHSSTRFSFKIRPKSTKSRDIKVIPLENGELTLTADAYNPKNRNERDVVERTIYVVAEGLRMRKSLTFVLDPAAKHATFNPRRKRKITMTDTATIKNSIDLRKKTQKTEIDLAMPREIIRGTGTCRISAFGDLMGDIINHAVVKSKSLMENAVHNAEEVLGDLGPSVHALLYANRTGLMDEGLGERSRKFVRHGVARLLRYRKDQGFALTPESPEGTWLTAAVLKTLCRSSHLTFIDRAMLIDHGFYWLLQQVSVNGTLEERSWRLANDSSEYQVMLSAEVLIAIMECDRTEQEAHMQLMYEMITLLEESLDSIQQPMVLAKVAYALTLFDQYADRVDTQEGEEGEGEEEEEGEEGGGGEFEEFEEEEEEEKEGMLGMEIAVEGEGVFVDPPMEPVHPVEPEPRVSEEAVKRLAAIARKNAQGQVFWSSDDVTDEERTVPFWYRQGVKASAIEATAYALLVFMDRPGANVDAIADWLVSQRNQHGSFIGALDSIAAIQALSTYSLQKTGVKVDLSCNVTSDKTRHHTHSFKFTQQNAIKPESLNNVPVGHSLEVMTKGQGLGQMQVNVEYNVPIDPNEKCDFNVTVEVKSTEVNRFPDMHPDQLCISCGWWCRPLVDNTTLLLNATTGNDTSSSNDTDVTTTPSSNQDGPRLAAVLSMDPGLPYRPPPPPPGEGDTPPALISPGMSISVSAGNRPGISVSGGRRSSRRRKLFRVRGRAGKTNAQNASDRKSSDRKRSGPRRARKPRSVRNHPSASRRSICLRVCLQHVNVGKAGHTRVEVEMLTGYMAVTTDIDRMKKLPEVVDAWIVADTQDVVVVFKEVSDEYSTCVGFRAVDHQEVGRPSPATVLVTEVGNPAPSCALEYRNPSRQDSLQVYCANFSNRNRGECRCYSGICSTCSPMTHREPMSYTDTKDLVCNSDVGYQVELSQVTDRDQWVEIDAKVLATNMTGTHAVRANDTIKMMSPASCICPISFDRRRQGRDTLYLLSTDVEKMVDSYGNTVHHYLLDEQSVFMRVSDTNSSESRSSSMDHTLLKYAFQACKP